MENEKKYTLKTAATEIKNLQKSRQMKLEKIQELEKIVKSYDKRIAEMEAIRKQLANEQLKEQVCIHLFSGGKNYSKLTIQKILELIDKLDGNVDDLCVDQIVSLVLQGSKTETQIASKSTTNSEKVESEVVTNERTSGS